MDILKDDIKKLYSSYLYPACGSSLVIAAYSFADTIAMGRGIGPAGAAANAILMPVFCSFTIFSTLCGVGGSILFSGAKALKKQDDANEAYTVSMLMALILSIMMTAFFLLFQEELYRFFGADEELTACSKEYGSILISFSFSFILSASLAWFIRNDGNPKQVMKASIIAAAVNMFGDWLFVFPLGMGLAGAALATILGSLANLAALTMHFRTKGCTLKFRFPKNGAADMAKTIIKNGFGTGFSTIITIIAGITANNQVMKYSGSAAMAVYGIISVIGGLFLYVYSGIGQACQPIVSANYAAEQKDRCLTALKLGIKSALVLSAAFTASCVFYPEELIAAFTKTTPEITSMSPSAVRLYSISFLASGLNIVLGLYLQSVKAAKEAAIITVARGIASAAFLLTLPHFFGIHGVWSAFGASEWTIVMLSAFYTIRNIKKN